jgi:FtsP/CotA-like multicopper oxidase with cupredoxin domain
MANVSADRLVLTARSATVDVGLGRAEAWTLNGSVPSPTIRLQRGRPAHIDLVNQLPERTILHWHGLAVPEAADGHPRLAIAPGAAYAYDFTPRDRAGTYWYHPHTHGRTAAQTYQGMAGLLIVEDEAEADLRLPSGQYEIPLILQDKRLGEAPLAYDLAMGPDMMMGYLGDTAFGNGVANPTVDVKRTRYRLRILNGSNARIFELGLSNGGAMTLIGTDGGLLDAPTALQRVTLATGERIDVLVDFSAARPGDRIMLRSIAFEVPGMMGMMMGMGRGAGGGRGRGMMGGMAAGAMQGTRMDLVEFVVTDSPAESQRPLPARLSDVPRIAVAVDTPRRTFRFNSMMMNHTINGRSFDMERIDERIRMGQGEVWTLINDSELPHPVHIHAGQFQVLSRTGGRGRVMPWERGLKDTMLLFPNEQVDVAVRFDQNPGVFLLHCHNLEHEDAGMMLNFEVVE